MGSHLITAHLGSRENADTRPDPRARSVELAIEAAELPEPVARGVRDLMRRLGLASGCLDFIVTPEGAHAFLEVDPMGQFPWIEHGNPGIALPAPFWELLLSRGGATPYVVPDAAPPRPGRPGAGLRQKE